MLESSTPTLSRTNIRTKAAQDRQAIYGAIIRSIREGALGAGSRIPTERELSAAYGAARNTVRKAMDALAAEGVVTRQVGRGTFVAGAAAADPASAGVAEVPSLPEILEARLLFEPGIAGLVVERADAADFEAMDRCLAGMRDAPDWAGYKEAKYALHLTMMRATRNRFLVEVFEAVIRARRRDGWGHRGEAAPVPSAVRSAGLAANAEIVEALRAGEAERARAAISDYLTRTLASVHGF